MQTMAWVFKLPQECIQRINMYTMGGTPSAKCISACIYNRAEDLFVVLEPSEGYVRALRYQYIFRCAHCPFQYTDWYEGILRYPEPLCDACEVRPIVKKLAKCGFELNGLSQAEKYPHVPTPYDVPYPPPHPLVTRSHGRLIAC